MIALLLGRMGGLAPGSGAEVDILPLHRQHFGLARASQQQQPENVGRLLVGVAIEDVDETFEFIGAEVTFARYLDVALDPLNRIGLTPLPFDGEGETARKQRHAGVGDARSAFAGNTTGRAVSVAKANPAPLHPP